MKEYMAIAIKESLKANQKQNVPVGAIIVKNDKIIAKAHNLKNSSGNTMDHAEIICIRRANKKVGDWRLNDCEMYVTLEPCDMCKEVIKAARLNKVYFLSKRNVQVCKEQTKFIDASELLNVSNIKNKENLRNFFQKIR